MLHCQLPRAFRRLARPSSPVIAKASTTCTYVLDPITLHPSCIKYLVRTRPVAGSRTERALVVANAITRTSALRPMRFSLPLPSCLSKNFVSKDSGNTSVSSAFQAHAAGGADRVRTDDPRLAKPVLSQLSYSPSRLVGLVGLEPTTPALSRRCSNQLSYRPSLAEIPSRATSSELPISVSACFQLLLLKGGDPAAGSPTATLLRLHPSHESHRGKRPPRG